jgi:hypothetical protein
MAANLAWETRLCRVPCALRRHFQSNFIYAGCSLETLDFDVTAIGPGREILLEQYDPAELETCIIEIHFPVERINIAEYDFLESIH